MHISLANKKAFGAAAECSSLRSPQTDPRLRCGNQTIAMSASVDGAAVA